MKNPNRKIELAAIVLVSLVSISALGQSSAFEERKQLAKAASYFAHNKVTCAAMDEHLTVLQAIENEKIISWARTLYDKCSFLTAGCEYYGGPMPNHWSCVEEALAVKDALRTGHYVVRGVPPFDPSKPVPVNPQ